MIQKGLDCKFDGAKDAWILTVPKALSPQMLKRVTDWLYGLWSNELARMNSFTQPDKFAFVSQAVSAAQRGRIQQVIVSKGDVVIFDAPMGGAKKTYI